MTIGSSPTSFIKISASFWSSGATTIKFLLPLCLRAHKAVGLVLQLTFLRFTSFSYPPQMGFSLRKLANRLFFFQILPFTVEVFFNLTPDEDQVVPALKVAHFNCKGMTEITFYAISQVRPCHISREKLEISKDKVVLFAKHFRKRFNATKYRVQHQREKWHWGHHDHSSLDHTIAGITSDIVISPEQCGTLAKGKDITLLGHSISFGFDTKNLPVIPAMTTGTNVTVKFGSLVTRSSLTCKQPLWKLR